MAENLKNVTSSSIDPLSFFRAGERAIEGWSRGLGVLTSEMVAFAFARMQADARAWTAVMTGASPTTLIDLQRQFAKAVTDYIESRQALSDRRRHCDRQPLGPAEPP